MPPDYSKNIKKLNIELANWSWNIVMATRTFGKGLKGSQPYALDKLPKHLARFNNQSLPVTASWLHCSRKEMALFRVESNVRLP